jgi:hypothetical protein
MDATLIAVGLNEEMKERMWKRVDANCRHSADLSRVSWSCPPSIDVGSSVASTIRRKWQQTRWDSRIPSNTTRLINVSRKSRKRSASVLMLLEHSPNRALHPTAQRRRPPLGPFLASLIASRLRTRWTSEEVPG